MIYGPEDLQPILCAVLVPQIIAIASYLLLFRRYGIDFADYVIVMAAGSASLWLWAASGVEHAPITIPLISGGLGLASYGMINLVKEIDITKFVPAFCVGWMSQFVWPFIYLILPRLV